MAGRSGDRILGGEIFLTFPDLPWRPPRFLYSGYWVSFVRLKRPGRGVDRALECSVGVKEELTHTLELRGLSTVNLTLV